MDTFVTVCRKDPTHTGVVGTPVQDQIKCRNRRYRTQNDNIDINIDTEKLLDQ